MNDALPDWVLYVCTAIGTIVAATITRLGWKSGEKEAASPTVSDLKADIAHLDSSSAILLAGALEAATKTAREMSMLTVQQGGDTAAAIRELVAVLSLMEKWREEEREEEEERRVRNLEDEVERLRRDALRRGQTS